MTTTDQSSTQTYSEWEGEITQYVADELEIPYSEAAGIVEGQPFYVQQAWGKGLNSRETADKVLKECRSLS
ncbi:hypothetical protein PVE_R2G0504 [Pseudomonas veronii 1YdBTEX2]|uniref:Uncharacterized protein n=1 Tax=Pseudomonas veronii 1YdBTEX2 TaxID=1295141 RepID=A0A1D3K896_PSEVE|nr:hypothetical protein PVE_R2G0504 [Pseudomonas veronii 1YdBTEX2]